MRLQGDGYFWPLYEKDIRITVHKGAVVKVEVIDNTNSPTDRDVDVDIHGR